MADVNRIILDKAVSDVELIPKLAHHLIDFGGKRLRPMLTIAAAKLCGYQGSGTCPAGGGRGVHAHRHAAARRRGGRQRLPPRASKSARLIWGNQASVLVGDFLLGQAFRMMVDVGSLPALRILSNAAAVIAEGEVMQLAAAKDTATTEKDYLAIIAAKTAALFSAATEVGAAIAGRPAEEQAALRSYGLNLGIVFQLVDDALDYAGESAQLGKSTGDDFREGKITLPGHPEREPRQRPGARLLAAHAGRRPHRARRLRARGRQHAASRRHRGDARPGTPLRHAGPRSACGPAARSLRCAR